MGVVKRSPSPPEACRNQLLPDWWAQQPSAGEDGTAAHAGDGVRGAWCSLLPAFRQWGAGGLWDYSDPILLKVTQPLPLRPLRKAHGPFPQEGSTCRLRSWEGPSCVGKPLPDQRGDGACHVGLPATSGTSQSQGEPWAAGEEEGQDQDCAVAQWEPWI